MASIPASTSRVAVLTVSYGSQDVLPGFLASIREASATPPIVFVADNKPDDAVRILTEGAGGSYLPVPANPGYGGALNVIARDVPADVEWFLVSNPDVVLAPAAIDRLLAAGLEDPMIGAVGPLVLTAEGDVYPSARAIPSLRTGIGHALFSGIWPGNPWTRSYRVQEELQPTRRDVGWLSGACLLVRRSVFESLDGFDESYFMYFEDVDLGYRIGKAGFRNVYEPAASVTHTGAHSTTTESARMVRAHHDSARRFLHRKYSGRVLWPVRASLTVGLRLRSWLVARKLGH